MRGGLGDGRGARESENGCRHRIRREWRRPTGRWPTRTGTDRPVSRESFGLGPAGGPGAGQRSGLNHARGAPRWFFDFSTCRLSQTRALEEPACRPMPSAGRGIGPWPPSRGFTEQRRLATPRQLLDGISSSVSAVKASHKER